MELFFRASLLTRILRKFLTNKSYGHVMKISRDQRLLSEPTTEVNWNDLQCERVTIMYNKSGSVFTNDS